MSHFTPVQQLLASALPLCLARDLDDERGVEKEAERLKDNLVTPSTSLPELPSDGQPSAEEPVSPFDGLRQYTEQDEFFKLL